ncbi:DUF655 domain-containing protein [Candidatus Woesearchaeota archaeon]|nr:DUF655 domain-containing protein [Candidatus Woesearchaeota archaeon]
MKMKTNQKREEYAIVLDFLRHGYSEDSRPFHKKESVVQAIGKDFFTLLELVPANSISIKPHDKVYIGEGKRDKISYIKSSLRVPRLTQTAKTELPFVVEKIVDENEEKFVEFFNKAGGISLRSHQLELLPGVGKRHAKQILKEREGRPFVSFEDVKKRVSAVPNPKKAIVQRILAELEGKDRYRLFVRV